MPSGGRPSRSPVGPVSTRAAVARETTGAIEPTAATGTGCSRNTCRATVSAGTPGETVTADVLSGITTRSTGPTVAGSTTVAIGARRANPLRQSGIASGATNSTRTAVTTKPAASSGGAPRTPATHTSATRGATRTAVAAVTRKRSPGTARTTHAAIAASCARTARAALKH